MKKANPTALGLFIVIGVALAVGGVLLFSSGRFLRHEVREIAYFDGSIDGLNVGAPVKYRGVPIGRVERILIRHNQSEEDFSMPVVLAINVKAAQSKSDEHLQIGNPAQLARRIKVGMRARLESESLLTGVLYINFEVFSNAPPPAFHQLKPEYQEIPTIPSQSQKLWAELSQIDLSGLVSRANALLTRADKSLAQINFPQVNEGLTNLLGSANGILAKPDLTNAIVAARRALDDAQKLLNHVDNRVDPLANSLTNTLAEAQKALKDVRGAVQHLSDIIGPDSSMKSDLTEALQQLGNASRAVADLADFLQRNPDALLRGRKQPKGQK